MRLLVVSDSHGNESLLRRVVRQHREAEVIIFLGDGTEEAERVRRELPPEQTLVAVRGNNDWGAGFPETCQLHLEGKRIFMAHGHTYRVKYGLKDFCDAARSRQADVALFGHTHQSLTLYEDGLYLMNPGALSYGRGGPSYGLVDLTPAGIVTWVQTLQ